MAAFDQSSTLPRAPSSGQRSVHCPSSVSQAIHFALGLGFRETVYAWHELGSLRTTG